MAYIYAYSFEPSKPPFPELDDVASVNAAEINLRAHGMKIYETFGKAHQVGNIPNASTTLHLQFQKERFQLWARSLGLFQQGHASLDYRVRDAFLVKQPLSSMLQTLLENLEELVSILLGERPPFEEQRYNRSKKEGDNELKEDKYENEEPDHSGSELSSPRDSDAQSDSENSFNEAECRLQLIAEAINSIYCLATKIRNPKNRPQRSLDQMCKHIPSNHRATHIQELEHLETVIVAYVQRQQISELLEILHQSNQQNMLSQYCLEDSWLIRRTGVANARRRIQFVYWKQHARRLGGSVAEPSDNFIAKEKHNGKIITLLNSGSVENQGQSLNKPISSAPPQSMATSATQIPSNMLKLQDATSVISHQSRVSTIFGPKGDKVTWPPPPQVTRGSNFFSCPYCLLLCPDSYLSSDYWRNHLIHDLQPYHCTYELCEDPNRLYGSRQEWIDHENQHTRVWHCQQHGDEFETQPEYIEHLQQYHENTKTEYFSAELLSSVVGPSMKPHRECPFCPTGFDSLVEIQRHLAFHLERLAVLALPRDEGDNDTDRGGNLSSKSHEAQQRGRKRSIHEDFEDGEQFIIDEYKNSAVVTSSILDLTEDNLNEERLLASASRPTSFTLPVWLDSINAENSFEHDKSPDETNLAEQSLGAVPTDPNNVASESQHNTDTGLTFYAELPAPIPATQDNQTTKRSSLYPMLNRLSLGQQFIPFLEQVEMAPKTFLDLPIRSPAYRPPEQPSQSVLAPGGSEAVELPRAQGYVEYLGWLN
ncbi:hypothetical protein NUW58_g2479 [Xylaria curta]|uniref:Uncharacterized protein n=1 Tax=Xylaria curta TaxID=42375 RepID=A0ACC1PH44_9PEZI|nr:hypothetical protein NUW58_g2479 [Xylaria curta]